MASLIICHRTFPPPTLTWGCGHLCIWQEHEHASICGVIAINILLGVEDCQRTARVWFSPGSGDDARLSDSCSIIHPPDVHRTRPNEMKMTGNSKRDKLMPPLPMKILPFPLTTMRFRCHSENNFTIHFNQKRNQ